MSNFILAKLNEEKNSFFTECRLSLFDIDAFNIIKIDTGCAYSNIAFQSFFDASKETARRRKGLALISHTKQYISFGASDTQSDRELAKDMIKRGKILDCKAVSFAYDTTLNFHTYSIQTEIRVNFDRDGNSLLGMDILKDFDIHIGKSLLTGEITFLGCRKEDVSAEYIQAIQDHLGYVPIETMQLAYQQGYDQAQLARIEGIYTAACWRDYLRELKGEKKGLFRR